MSTVGLGDVDSGCSSLLLAGLIFAAVGFVSGASVGFDSSPCLSVSRL